MPNTPVEAVELRPLNSQPTHNAEMCERELAAATQRYTDLEQVETELRAAIERLLPNDTPAALPSGALIVGAAMGYRDSIAPSHPDFSATYRMLRSRATSGLGGITSAIRDHRAAAQVWQKRLKSAKEADRTPPVQISAENLRDALSRIANIEKRSIKLERTESGTHVVSFVFDGLEMTPSANPHIGIQFGKVTPVKLSKFRVIVPLIRNAQTTVARVRGTPGYSLYTHSAVHPHQMRSGGQLCLGDFAGPLEELRMALDIPTYVTVLREFFAQAASDDPAGRTWVNIPGQQFCRQFSRQIECATQYGAQAYVRAVPNFSLQEIYGSLIRRGDVWKFAPLITGRRRLASASSIKVWLDESAERMLRLLGSQAEVDTHMAQLREYVIHDATELDALAAEFKDYVDPPKPDSPAMPAEPARVQVRGFDDWANEPVPPPATEVIEALVAAAQVATTNAPAVRDLGYVSTVEEAMALVNAS